MRKSAIAAQTIDLKKVRNHFPLQRIFHFPDYFLFTAKLEVLDPATGYTDKMVMMAGIITIVIVKFTVRVDNLYNDSAIRKFFQVSVNGWESDSFETYLKFPPNLLRTKVAKCFGKNFKDCNPFGCCLETKFLYYTTGIHWVMPVLNRINF